MNLYKQWDLLVARNLKNNSKELKETHLRKLKNMNLPFSHLEQQRNVFNFSSKPLSKIQFKILEKGPNYVLTSYKPNKNRIYTEVENFVRKIKGHFSSINQELNSEFLNNLEFENEDYIKYSKHSKFSNLSKIEKEEFSKLTNDKSIIIIKSDKVNSFVILDKFMYIEKSENFLN